MSVWRITIRGPAKSNNRQSIKREKSNTEKMTENSDNFKRVSKFLKLTSQQINNLRLEKKLSDIFHPNYRNKSNGEIKVTDWRMWVMVIIIIGHTKAVRPYPFNFQTVFNTKIGIN